MMNETLLQREYPPATGGQLVAGIGLGYLIAAGLLTSLVMAAGVWNFLGISRLLDPLIQGGIVQYHDKQLGFIAGVPELKYYVMSQDPVKWGIAMLAVLGMLAFWALKSIQFHGLARGIGISGGLGDDSRAFLFGQGLNRWLPFGLGDNGIVMAMGRMSGDNGRAAATLQLTRFLMLFEILFFAAIGLLFLGWGMWLSQIFWALVILVATAALVRPVGALNDSLEFFVGLKPTLDWLMQRPALAVQLVILSIAAFFLEHVSVFLLSQAFTSTNVILNIEFHVFLMALVAGNIARLVPVTPGGLGQFEWGFAAAIYLSGTGMPEAVSIALLFAMLRYLVGFAITASLRLFYGVEVTMRDVLGAVRVGN